MTYDEIILRRRALTIEGYSTLADVHCDGNWVTPYQIASRSPTGPVLVAYNWLDAPTAISHREILLELGYLPNLQFNVVMDRALKIAGMSRSEIYVTQAFHLLPGARSAAISARDVNTSFDSVTRHELVERRVIALGRHAEAACRRHAIRLRATCHPSARGKSYQSKANELSAALIQSK